jgi:hypothetical protein
MYNNTAAVQADDYMTFGLVDTVQGGCRAAIVSCHFFSRSSSPALSFYTIYLSQSDVTPPLFPDALDLPSSLGIDHANANVTLNYK